MLAQNDSYNLTSPSPTHYPVFTGDVLWIIKSTSGCNGIQIRRHEFKLVEPNFITIGLGSDWKDKDTASVILSGSAVPGQLTVRSDKIWVKLSQYNNTRVQFNFEITPISLTGN